MQNEEWAKNGQKVGWKKVRRTKFGVKSGLFAELAVDPGRPQFQPFDERGSGIQIQKKIASFVVWGCPANILFPPAPRAVATPPPPPGSHPSMSTPLQYASEWDCGKGACALNGFHRMLFSLRPCPTPPTPSFRPYALDSGGARQPNPEPLCVDAGPDCCCRRWSGNGLPPPEPCLAPPNAACHVRGRLANICKHLSLQDIPDDTLFSSFSPDYNNPSITFDGSKLIFRF